MRCVVYQGINSRVCLVMLCWVLMTRCWWVLVGCCQGTMTGVSGGVRGLFCVCCVVVAAAMLVGLVGGEVGGLGLGLGPKLVECLQGSRSGLAGVKGCCRDVNVMVVNLQKWCYAGCF